MADLWHRNLITEPLTFDASAVIPFFPPLHRREGTMIVKSESLTGLGVFAELTEVGRRMRLPSLTVNGMYLEDVELQFRSLMISTTGVRLTLRWTAAE